MKKSRQTRRRQNRLSKLMICTVFMVLLVILSVKGMELQKKNDEFIKKESTLRAKIDEEEKRTEEIKEFEKYSQTKKYVEEVAKDKLGLVYEDEILFKNE